jgi:diaminopimelate epimerase
MEKRKIEFYKLEASGNDFILINNYHSSFTPHYLRKFAIKYCSRKLGIGADGVLVMGHSKVADYKMRIFNPDGSEAEMCGNGARCAALWANFIREKKKEQRIKAKAIKLETKAGIIESEVVNYVLQSRERKEQAKVRIKMVAPFSVRLNSSLNIFDKDIKVNYINTGVPHIVIFTEGLDEINVESIGRQVRYHNRFMPAGTNVDFVEVIGKDFIKVRTYERGVETETLACGTGVVASAIIAGYKLETTNYKNKWRVLTKSKEVLKVYFTCENSKIKDVWLEGKVCFVYKGEVNY